MNLQGTFISHNDINTDHCCNYKMEDNYIGTVEEGEVVDSAEKYLPAVSGDE